MDERILDPDGARERLAAWKGRIDQLAADTEAMSERMQAVRVTASDPNGLAEVTIDSTGTLVDLRLTDRIQRVPPTAVAQAIMATLGDARARMADRSQEIIADTIGTRSAAGRAIAESVGQHLRGGPAPHRPVHHDDDEGFDSHSYLRER
ncbi:YbaB/EbfC family nucleoid-associated protein [Saccharothrix variisporea]|uniref:YbaB/EbfC DNA-binding family protein n=1 Tax=Saccharothrix variisporea TaxID=543527 RepID=A0A495XJM4_9PSEU|nr:YbaB/EbfC family nucleoid-associated protein [Saccharothrix variisporea]RKT74721.1 YbaB/EbfC DNA-binding family protein [Saccharothrix variisporea]